MTNPIKLAELFNDLPEGVKLEDRRARLTAIFGIAAAAKVQGVGPEVLEVNRRLAFNDNVGLIKDKLWKINEVLMIDVDRALDYAFALWQRRMVQATSVRADVLLSQVSNYDFFAELIPNFTELQIGTQIVDAAINELCDQ